MKAEYGTLVSGDLHENTLVIEMDEAITLRAGNYAVIRIESTADQERLNELLNNQPEQKQKIKFIMKTAMQWLMEILDKEIKYITKDDDLSDRYFQSGLKHAYNLAKDKLAQERKQIAQAVEYGFSDANRPNPDSSFEDYYTQTFGTNKETLN